MHVDDHVQTSVGVTPEAGDATHVDDDIYVHVDDFAKVHVTPEASDAMHVRTEPHVDMDEYMHSCGCSCGNTLFFYLYHLLRMHFEVGVVR
ncbi:hypothetical protein ACS0TY_001900 [Phlomoides rotata]